MKRTCWYCGTKSEGPTCTCCDADLDAQEVEIAALNGIAESDCTEQRLLLEQEVETDER